MPRPFTREGLEARVAIRKAFEANTALTRADLRRLLGVVQPLVDSAMAKTAVEWQALLEAAPLKDTAPKTTARERKDVVAGGPVMPGIEQDFLKFDRRPAKMGDGCAFWIPRAYIKNGLVDPDAKYDIYIKKKNV